MRPDSSKTLALHKSRSYILTYLLIPNVNRNNSMGRDICWIWYLERLLSSDSSTAVRRRRLTSGESSDVCLRIATKHQTARSVTAPVQYAAKSSKHVRRWLKKLCNFNADRLTTTPILHGSMSVKRFDSSGHNPTASPLEKSSVSTKA